MDHGRVSERLLWVTVPAATSGRNRPRSCASILKGLGGRLHEERGERIVSDRPKFRIKVRKKVI